jgi:outer membrane lipoprotein carrier protein
MLVIMASQAQETQFVPEPITVDPLKLLNEVRNDLSGLESAFIQYELIDGGEKADLNTGRVWMQAPDQFRWHYLDPIEQLIVADGQKVWVYDEDLEQVTVKTQSNQLNPIYVIINDEKSQQHYDIKHEVQSQGIDWISLTPKVPNEEVETVWLAIEKSLVTQIKVVNKFSQTMIFEFSDIKKNPDFKTGLFEFVPPDGVDVVQAIAEDTTGEF